VLAGCKGFNREGSLLAVLAVIGYTYIGYAGWLSLCVRFHRLPVRKGNFKPDISVVIAVRNEEANLSVKLENLRRLDYPKDKFANRHCLRRVD